MAFLHLKFAKINLEKIENKKEFLKKLSDNLKRQGMRGSYAENRKGFYNVEVFNTFISFYYYKDLPSKVDILNRSNTDLEEVPFPDRELKRILVFEEGYIVYETFRLHKGSFKEIRDRINQAWSLDNKEQLDVEEIKEFDHHLLKEFYKRAERISHLKVIETGKIKPNPHYPARYIKELVEDYGKFGNSVEFKTRNKKGENLKKTEIVDKGFFPISLPLFVAGKEKGDIHFSIHLSGKITSYAPDDTEKKEQRMEELARRVISSFERNKAKK